ncbi:MAG TPA: hypothetical protein PLF35_09600, partial [Prolixibacteraceae bacterium]|nr:hypothetical protein [Prolixibacteraceae bacterium]
LVLLLNSCLNSMQEFNRSLKDFVGEWQLTQMTYTNEKGEHIDVEKISSTIVFRDIKVSDVESNRDREGTLFINDDSISFRYNLTPESNKINLHVHQDSLIDKPIYAIGKVNQYNYEMIDKNELIFNVDAEYVYPTNEKLTNPVYVFERK